MIDNTEVIKNFNLEEKIDYINNDNLWIKTKDINNKNVKIKDYSNYFNFDQNGIYFKDIINTYDLNLIKTYAKIIAASHKKDNKNFIVFNLDHLNEDNDFYDSLFSDVFYMKDMFKTFIKELKSNDMFIFLNVSIENINYLNEYVYEFRSLIDVLIVDEMLDNYNDYKFVFIKDKNKYKLLNDLTLNQNNLAELVEEESIDESQINDLVTKIYNFNKSFYIDIQYEEDSNLLNEFLLDLSMKSTIYFKYDKGKLFNLVNNYLMIYGDFNLGEEANELNEKYFNNIISNNDLDIDLDEIETALIFYEDNDVETINMIDILFENNVEINIVVPNELKILNEDIYNKATNVISLNIHNIYSLEGFYKLIRSDVFYHNENSSLKTEDEEGNIKEVKSISPTNIYYSKLNIYNNIINVDLVNEEDTSQYVTTIIKDNETGSIITYSKTYLSKGESKTIKLEVDKTYNENKIELNLNFKKVEEDIPKTYKVVKIILMLLTLVVINTPLFVILLTTNDYFAEVIMISIMSVINLSLIVYFIKLKVKPKKVKNKPVIFNVDSLNLLNPIDEEIYEKIEIFEEEDELEEVKLELVEDINYDNIDNFNQYIIEFKEFLSSYGIVIDIKYLHKFIAAISSGRLIILNTENQKMKDDFLEAFTIFFGANYINNFYNTLEVFDSVNKNKDLLNIINVSNEDYKNSTLKELFNCLKYPNGTCEVSFHDTNITTTSNIWLFLNDDNYNIEELNSLIKVDIEFEYKEQEEVIETKGEKVSYFYFNEIVDGIKDKLYLDEDDWKKIDELNVHISKFHKGIFNNNSLIQSEKYTSLLLYFEYLKEDVIDSLLVNKFLPIINLINIVKKDDEEEGLHSVCDRLFGLENLTRSNYLLTRIRDNTKLIGDIND